MNDIYVAPDGTEYRMKIGIDATVNILHIASRLMAPSEDIDTSKPASLAAVVMKRVDRSMIEDLFSSVLGIEREKVEDVYTVGGLIQIIRFILSNDEILGAVRNFTVGVSQEQNTPEK